MNSLKHTLEYWTVRFFSRLFASMPWSTALRFGYYLGVLVYHFIPIRRQVALMNLRSVFPEKTAKDLQQIALRTYCNFGMTIAEYLMQPRWTPDRVASQLEFVNAHFFAQARQNGRGTLCLSGHFGNWELMGSGIQALGYPISGIVRPQKNTRVDQLLNANRHAAGLGIIPLGMAVRGVLKALHSNEFVAILADQDAHDEGIFVNFLGRPSSTAPGPAVFALKSGAEIIFGAVVRQRNGKHKAFIEKIERTWSNELSPENIRTITQAYAQTLEKYIFKYPDHWFWMHKRWKTKPPPGYVG